MTQPTDPRPANPVGGEALLPCPFCGDQDSVSDIFTRDGRKIVCKCGASMIRFQPKASEKAIAAWNTRAALSAPSVTGEAVAWRSRKRAARGFMPEWQYEDGEYYGGLDPKEYEVQPLYAAPVSAHEGGEAAATDWEVLHGLASECFADEAAKLRKAVAALQAISSDSGPAMGLRATANNALSEIKAFAALSPTALSTDRKGVSR